MPWKHPAQKAPENKAPAVKVPEPVVRMSAEEQSKLKQAKVMKKNSPSLSALCICLIWSNGASTRTAQVETNASGSTVKMPTAEAIAMLQKRRAAAAAASKAAGSKAPRVGAAAGPMDVCAAARERTLKAKAAANLNRAAPPTQGGQTKVDGEDLLSSFLRPGIASAVPVPGAVISEEEKAKRALEGEKIRKARAEAAQRDRENGNLRSSGATVNVPSAQAIEMLRIRREKASEAAKNHVRPAANEKAAKKVKRK